jgi:hypothetical protein
MNDYQHDIYSNLKVTMITVSANISNISLNEKNDIGDMIPTGNIRCIHSNFGTKFREGYNPVIPIPKKTNKGRKPKKKKITSNRQRQGKLMHTQTTFEIESKENPDKIYKCRVFRTGGLNIPGALRDDLSDITDILSELEEFFQKHYSRNDIKCCDIDDPMNGKCTPLRNYTSSLMVSSDNIGVNIRRLYTQLHTNPHRDDIDDILPMGDKGCSNLTIKFSRPTLKKEDATSTLKISRKKLRFEGFKTRNDADDIFAWINMYIKKYYNEVVHDPEIQNEDESSDTDDYIPAKKYRLTVYEKKIDNELTNLMESTSLLQ